MNKKFADVQSGLIVVGVIVYFMIFTFLITIVSSYDSSISNQNTNILNSVYYSANPQSFAYCDNPRYRYDYSNPNPYQISLVNDNYLKCEWTGGIQSQNECNNLSGCTWQEVDTTSWFYQAWCFLGVGCADAPFICNGYMNVSKYNIDTINNGQRVANYYYLHYYGNKSAEYDALMEYFGYTKNISTGLLFGSYAITLSNTSLAYDIDFFKDDTICRNPNVILNQSLCNQFECTWKTETLKDENVGGTQFKNPVKILGLALSVFTFNYDFGFDNNIFMKTFCYILFVLIPLLILAVALRNAVF